MRIPEIQAELREMALEYGRPRLAELADALSRRKSARAPVRSRKMTPALERAIRAYAKANPDARQQDIANVFEVNPGRVSEALRGFRV